MTSERDIKGNIAALREAVAANDSEVSYEAGLNLLEGFLLNIARIADAAEYLALEPKAHLPEATTKAPGT